MGEFKSLKPAGLPEEFDAEVHGEEAIVKELRETKDKIEIDFIFPGFTLSDETEMDAGEEKLAFREVGISKCGWLSESGKPLLPSFGRYVQIPSGQNFEVSVKKSKPVRFDDIIVTPSQEEAMDGEEEHEFEFDQKAYSKDKLYPAKLVEVSGPFDIDGYNSLLIHVRPLQYNAVKRQLVGYSNITIVIKLTPKEESDEEEEIPFVDESVDRRAFGNLFLNPTRVYRVPIAGRPELVFPIRGPKFLIIYAEQFKNAAEKLAKWKNLKGLSTEIVSINTVGNTESKIKNYIRNRRKFIFSRLRYVLLFGDIDHISHENVGGNCTDHYYFTSKDPGSSSEYVLAWISGGRIPVRNAQQAMDVVDQIIRYEKNPPSDPQYYRRIVGAAYFQDDSPQDGKANRAYMKTIESIREHLVSVSMDVERVYVSNNPNPQYYKDDSPIPVDVRAAIVDNATATQMLIDAANEGQLIFGHRNHGSPYGWAHPTFQIGNLSSITGLVPSMFYSVNCQTGRFDSTSPTECFAEAILAKNGAAPSLIAATRNSGTWRNDSLTKAMFDAMYPGVLPTFPGTTASYAVKNNRLGDILNYGMSYLPVAHSGVNYGIKAHTEIYHVIGDPTLELWPNMPLLIRMSVSIIRSLYLLITLSSCPRGGYLSVWVGDKMLKGLHPTSSQIKISIPREIRLLEPRFWTALPPFRRKISVCFAAPGYRFVQVNVRAPFLPMPPSVIPR